MTEQPDWNSDPFADGKTFALVLRVLPGEPEGRLRVRKALKSLLRGYGLRNECLTSIEDLPRAIKRLMGDPSEN